MDLNKSHRVANRPANKLSNYQANLVAEFNRRKGKNPRYTLRSFALALGVAPSTLLAVMKGQRHFHILSATKVSTALKWSSSTFDQMLREITLAKMTKIKKLRPQREFDDLCEWHLMAIAKLATLKNVSAEPSAIARRLGITEAQAAQALSSLVEKGYIRVRGRHLKPGKPAGPFYIGKPTTVVISYQQQLLMKAAEALASVAPPQRMSLIQMLPVHPEDLEELGTMMGTFFDRINKKANSNKKMKELYCLSMQLFPLTKPIKD